MKKLFTILALIASVLAIILAVLPVSNLAILPAIAALIFGIAAYYFSKRTGHVKKIIQFTFLLTSIALVIAIYKAIFDTTVVTETKKLDAKEEQLQEEAIEELEGLDIELEEFEDIPID